MKGSGDGKRTASSTDVTAHLLKARFVQQPVEFLDVAQRKGYAAVGTPKWRTASS
jgi:hypothetical protein